jgi:hypothetical protein
VGRSSRTARIPDAVTVQATSEQRHGASVTENVSQQTEMRHGESDYVGAWLTVTWFIQPIGVQAKM